MAAPLTLSISSIVVVPPALSIVKLPDDVSISLLPVCPTLTFPNAPPVDVISPALTAPEDCVTLNELPTVNVVPLNVSVEASAISPVAPTVTIRLVVKSLTLSVLTVVPAASNVPAIAVLPVALATVNLSVLTSKFPPILPVVVTSKLELAVSVVNEPAAAVV